MSATKFLCVTTSCGKVIEEQRAIDEVRTLPLTPQRVAQKAN